MTTDRLFVIMLVMLIPMTGCFGAVDNADAQDDTTENTNQTIVNNYYYNNTTTVETPVIEKFAIGGMADSTMSPYDNSSSQYHVYTLNTTAGEAIRIHQAELDKRSGWSMPKIDTNCVNGGHFTTMPGENYGLQPTYLPGSYTDCEHKIVILGEYGWSMMYSIESVTVA